MAQNTLLATATERLAALRAQMKHQELEGLVVTHGPSLRYLFGFSGSAAMAVIGLKKILFVTNDLYDVQVQQELIALPGLSTAINRNFWQAVTASGIASAWKTIGFDAARTSVSALKPMKKAVSPAKLVEVSGLVEAATMAKAPYEIKQIGRAAEIVSRAYEHMLGVVGAGVTEREVANYLATKTRELGSEKDAFDIIVVAGVRSAMPHGRASTSKLKKGDVVTVDFGACVNGLYSDMTRTFCIGTPKKKIAEVFAVLYDAHLTALDAARAGITGAELDASARTVISTAGYGEYFRHSLGHGLGYEVHEHPRVAAMATREVLPVNCVVTIEPGIYIPGEFGMRIEDDVVIGTKGASILTSAPRELVVV